MDESPKNDEKKGKPFEKIFSIVLIAIIIIAAIFFINFNFLSGNTDNVLTSTYNIVPPKEAYDLIKNQSKGLTIVDIRSCKCNYEKNHLPDAIWNINPKSFFNTTDDLLIYDNDGTISINFCKDLVGKVYGKIMYLQGGMDTWLELGYPVIT
jgi:rhodanese-related sulfurtransferase